MAILQSESTWLTRSVLEVGSKKVYSPMHHVPRRVVRNKRTTVMHTVELQLTPIHTVYTGEIDHQLQLQQRQPTSASDFD